MGTTKLFIFCILFLSMEGIILYMYEQSENPYLNYDNSLSVMNAEPPQQPNFNAENPFSFIQSTIDAGAYAVAVSVYTINLIISLFSFPFLIASRVMAFNTKYPFLLIVNGTVISFLAYSVISRLTGGD